MPRATVQIDMLNLPFVQRVMLAAYDLLQEVEDGDTALLPDSVVEAAATLRAEVEKGTDA